MNAQAAPTLIFDDKKSRISAWRLPLFLFLSLLGHAAVFYLFKVVTPTSTRDIPREHTVVMLRGVDPIVEELLLSLEGRSPAGLRVKSIANPDIALDKLPTLAYRSSFAGYTPTIRFNWQSPESPLPGLVNAHLPMLPKSPAPALPSVTIPAEAPPVTPVLVLSSRLKSRGLARPAAWPKDLSAPEELAEVHQFTLGIHSSGRVDYCLTGEKAPPVALHQAVKALRFRPAPSLNAPIDWGTIEVHW